MSPWLTLPGLVLALTACADSSLPDSPAAPHDAPVALSADAAPALNAASDFAPETAVYRCRSRAGEIHLVTRTREGGLHVFLPPGVQGGHLECDHDRRASIWEHAKLNGVSFRAVGNEPGWVLEIREGERLDLNYDYGQGELSLPIVEFSTDSAARTSIYKAASGADRMTVRLSGQGCSDTMSDETFPTRVEVEFDGRILSGCGRPLH